MVKNILFSATIVFILGAFNPVQSQKRKQITKTNAKADLKFLDDISIDLPKQEGTDNNSIRGSQPEPQFADKKITEIMPASSNVENANTLQFKYALLLNIEVEQIQNLNLFKLIDEWIGTRYRLGGSTKSGIDCSAFMQVLFTAIYGITLPRTAKEQYNLVRKISRSELKEGDLVFFHTAKRGVSHVGMYLQNNKFVHASSSGVTISDLYDDYWSRKIIGAGRIEHTQQIALASQP